jgi:hypothetical protein
MEQLWNKKEHHFGEVKYNTTHDVIFNYLGNENLSVDNFIVNCSCTRKMYDRDKKELKLFLDMNQYGEKLSVVSINYPKGNSDFILLKATVK